MSDTYLRTTGGSDANDGLSWATPKLTMVAAAAMLAAGETLYVADDYLESGSSNKSIIFAGTPALPCRVICATTASNPPTVQANTGYLNTTVGGTPTFTGSIHVFGLKVNGGSGTSSGTIILMNSQTVDTIQTYEDCEFSLNGTGISASVFSIGSSNSANTAKSRMIWKECRLKFNATAHQIAVFQEFTWRGGQILAGAAAPSYLLRVGAQGRSVPVLIEGVDMSGLGALTDLVSGPGSAGRVMFRNCALPAGWNGYLVQGLIDPGLRVEMHNCDSADTNYRLWIMAFTGAIRSDTAKVKTGGANDGTTGFSWKIDTNANTVPGLYGLESCELARWNDTVGSPVTVGIDTLIDGAALTNAEAWIEVQYLGTSGLPKGSFAGGRPGPLTTPVAQAASAATWNTSGMTSPQKQRLSATFTPQEAGMMLIKVVFARQNATLYVDPKVV